MQKVCFMQSESLKTKENEQKSKDLHTKHNKTLAL